MKIEVLPDRAAAHPSWIVRSRNLCVRFNNEAAAKTYAHKLEARLNAPHTWPGHAPQNGVLAAPAAREMQPRAV